MRALYEGIYPAVLHLIVVGHGVAVADKGNKILAPICPPVAN